MLALGVLLTVDQRRPRRSRTARSPGPDPWKANTLEWFTPSPPPENNFDVIPRVRSVEPMKDIRRQIEQQTGVEQRYRGRPADGQRLSGGVPRSTRRRARRSRGVRQVLADYVDADQAAVQLAAAADDDHDDVRGGRPVARRSCALTVLGGSLSAGGAGAVNHCYDRDIDAADGPHGQPAGARRAGSRRARRCAFGFALQPRCRSSLLADAVNVLARARSRCAGFLGYVLVYTIWLKRRDAAEHRDRRRRRRGAAARRLGRGDRPASTPAALYLFAIVFYWTPPHFWALSLLMKDEYARVGVPMMPVVHGEAETRRQIVLYTLPADAS